MNELQVFQNPAFGSVRALNIEGEPWFVGKDVAEILRYERTTKAVADRVDAEDRMMIDGKTQSQFGIELGQRGGWLINESGLYSLILSSKLDSAKAFKRWVTSEVLPSIRKTGGYIAGSADMSDMEIMSKAFLIAQRTICERDAAIKRLESDNRAMSAEIAAFAPVRGYVNEILSSPGTLTTTQIAADYGMSARKLNGILREEKIQHKVNGQWILYREQMEKGYTKSVTIPIKHRDGTPDTKMHTQWTQKGRLMIHGILTRRGVLANADNAEAAP